MRHVQSIVAINDYALHTIARAQVKSTSLAHIVWPFGSEPATQAAVLDAFHKSMEVHASEIKRLQLEAEVSSANLVTLEENIATLHDICTREKILMSAGHDVLLSALWTRFGGNSARVRASDTNLDLLRDLAQYRRLAATHVAVALQTLHAMEEDVEDLRERVSAPDLVRDTVPVEVHMANIREGMDRLKEKRIKAKKTEEMLTRRILEADP